jgi:hypothetical protein
MITDANNLIVKILQERFIELAFEGFRYNDLRRTDYLDEVMSEHNTDSWESTDRYFPIPQNEVNLGLPQNDGYF